jgi:hypothetical protein
VGFHRTSFYRLFLFILESNFAIRSILLSGFAVQQVQVLILPPLGPKSFLQLSI